MTGPLALLGGAAVGSLFLSMHSCVNAMLVRRPVASSHSSHNDEVEGEGLTVCIPARNEASNIEACLQAVLANRGVADLRVVVLDDGSTDSTGEMASALAKIDSRVQVIAGGDAAVPSGWIGKTWACERLWETVTTSVVVFVDADVRLGPTALVAGLQMLREHSLSLVSPYPKQLVGSWAERFTQPLLQWLWLTFLPLRLAERSKAPSLTAANGQFMMLDTKALRSIGGFSSVAGEVLDDVALARSLKRAGFRATVAEGSTLATCRMYDGWPALRDGYTKNLWSATGSPFGAAAMIGLFGALYLLPVFGTVAGALLANGQLLGVGLAGYAAGVFGRMVTARTTGGSVRDAIFHPISIGILAWLIVRSWRKHRRGAITWKGRSL
jgi:cellulose synthase/poly-beta-1,6-N-acetylglucosamine synthase-like glycosyltransferase